MVRIIHLHQAANQVLAPGHLLNKLLHHLEAQGRARIVNEKLFLALNLLDVAIACDIPKRFIAFW